MDNQEQNTMEHLEKQLSLLTESVKEIRTALLGNEFNEGGLLAWKKDIEKRVSSLEDESKGKKPMDKFLYTLIVAGATGVVMFLLNQILKK